MRTEASSLCEALSSRATVTRMCTTSHLMFWMLHSAREVCRVGGWVWGGHDVSSKLTQAGATVATLMLISLQI